MSWLAVFGKGLEALAKLVPFIGAYRAGKILAKLERLKQENERLIKQNEIANSRPVSRSKLIERMRNGKL
jgi:hypothetical protein